ncbi:MAG: hypothetical protein AVDCRST_MAG51-1843 [uncultured Ramlibacter sp.]|uniref:Uncharacterized protein n=1 Tax=uncultured Ramlibacter sp. TaxID=260755 RepID=A0A6J4PMR9_9BURK|nr:MAG: hypothetical protein AVDCRST_MAG51-1843 [uncultured Ramlibacter sp.]
MYAEYRKVVVAAVLFFGACEALAQEAKAQAETGALADGVSSMVGIAAGAPLNPLLPVFGAALKAAAFQHAESLPETERPRAYAMAAAGWQGSAAGNACVAVSAVSGGAFLPACIVVGVAWGWNTWNASEGERRDAQRCAVLRASAGNPKLRCASMRHRIELAAASTPTFIAAQDLVAP